MMGLRGLVNAAVANEIHLPRPLGKIPLADGHRIVPSDVPRRPAAFLVENPLIASQATSRRALVNDQASNSFFYTLAKAPTADRRACSACDWLDCTRMTNSTPKTAPMINPRLAMISIVSRLGQLAAARQIWTWRGRQQIQPRNATGYTQPAKGKDFLVFSSNPSR
jgi:hypothetical protein